MLVSERALKWAMRFYPPLFFQRIRVIRFHDGFRGVEVKITKSFLNTNHDKSIFGGTICAAADPWHPILFSNILRLKGCEVKAWSRSSAIRFLKPAKTSVHFTVSISDLEIEACEKQLNLTGKYRKSFQIGLYDRDEKLCASVINEMYIRDLKHPANNQ
jgi:acyl-coenzyme A thioesterase PaaI-like protein